jgi:dTDP-4-dehydrorhamnose reductase
MNKILIIGCDGQVGSSLKKLFGGKADAVNRNQFDLARPETLTAKLQELKPRIIINAAAYTSVDKAEDEQDLAHLINAESPKVIAEYAQINNIPFIHYSTDYVFDGSGNKPWQETDLTKPLSIYGKSKLAGENNITNLNGKYLIFRTSWVYNEFGNNFLKTMFKLGKEKEALSIISDQYGSPTYAYDLAIATKQSIEFALKCEEFPTGIYHLCNEGITTWYEYADTIFELAKKLNIELIIKNVLPITSDQYPTKAKRPLNSRMDCNKVKNRLQINMPKWQESLKNCINNMKLQGII